MTRKVEVAGARLAVVISIALLLLPRLASACSVCFGASDSSMAKGTNNGIFFMLGVIGLVQIGFIGLFVTFWRRARALRRHKESFRLIDGGSGKVGL